MDMPKPTPAHDALQMMAGTWEGEEILHPSPFAPAGGAATARVTSTRALAGFALLLDYEQRRDGRVAFTGHGVLWFDARQKQYVMTWWDSWGMPPLEYRGAIANGSLELVSKSAQGFVRTTWDFTSGHSYRYRMDMSDDGAAWAPFLDGEYRRI